MALGPVADGLFPLVLGAAEAIARQIAKALSVTDSKVERAIQFLVYVLIICPLLLLAAAAWVEAVRWLFSIAGGHSSVKDLPC